MLHLRIDYYASLRERRGLDREEIDTDETDLGRLYASLAARHGFSLRQAEVRPAVNDEFCDWTRPLADRDRIVFVPPMAGG
jgi:molybdopterin converting factor small subunit